MDADAFIFRETNRKANENTRYESETVRAVRKMVNGGKMYPKAISMKLEDELNFEKKQNSKTKKNRSSQKSSKSSKTTKSDDKMGTSNVHLDSAFETASTVSSKINDNTLDYGDWAIMEPGKFYYINGWFEIIFLWLISDFFPEKSYFLCSKSYGVTVMLVT